MPETTQQKNEKIIMLAMTEDGGFTRETLAGWGVPWPPPKGWKRALIRQGFPYKVMPPDGNLGRYSVVDEDAAQLWSEGAGTKEIADVLHCWEHDVYNRLNKIKRVAKRKHNE